MFRPSSMEIISILVEKDKEKEITSHLIRSGIFQPVDIKNVESLAQVDPYSSQDESESLSYVENGFNKIISGLNLENLIDDSELLNKVQAIRIIENMKSELMPFVEEKTNIQNKIKTEELVEQQLTRNLPFPGYRTKELTFLETVIGKIDGKNLDKFKKILTSVPYVFYPFREEDSKIVFLVMLLKKDKNVLEEAFRTSYCEKVELPASDNLTQPDKLKESIAEKKKNVEAIDKEISSKVEKFKKDIGRIQFFIKFGRSLMEAKKFAWITENTILISGWIPSGGKDLFLKEVKNMSDSHYIESKKAEETNISKEKVPVLLSHSFLVKPFEIITKTYGLPRYGTIDPTLFIAIVFPIMFGAMFGDFGHGFVLSLAGLAFIKLLRKKGFLHVGLLLLYCGVSAMIFGLLYGSFFGIRFTPIWLDPMYSIMFLFKISIWVGIGFLTTAILINIINFIKDKEYVKALFDGSGLFSGIFYWSALGVCFKFIYSGYISYLLIFVAAGSIILLFLRPVFEKILLKKKESLLAEFTESTPHLIDVGLTYLTNTLSFLRIAAFELAHAALLMATFIIAKLIGNFAAGSVFLLIVILGNLGIILMEGLIVSIQVLRLHYYEFFSRFYVVSQEKYNPIKI
ncbi:MAG: hypothetical protein M1501_03375 [Candidatus Omnitrophica bacterium]|nr:hypothetical protein [Candidatus Omnitrophota bacterium]